MSEVKRDHREELSDELVKHLQAGVLDSRKAYTYMWDDVCIGAALAQEYAQSELAALREELARVQKISDNYYSLTVEANQRLADAERRNAELVELLQECVNTVRFGEDFDLPVTTMARIDAALKPTESGASE